MDAVKVGHAIKTLRLKIGYTQHRLAENLGVTDQAVSKWERGLSVPDISIITKLSLLLNVDVDTLLEGNITYLDKNWQGLLLLRESADIFSGSEVYGKPLVYLYLSYFMLAGIGDIFISCPERDRDYIVSRLKDGSHLGIRLHFLESGRACLPQPGNTMVVFRNPFVYGPNLTKYFQRAMSRRRGISILTVTKAPGDNEPMVSYDSYRVVRAFESDGIQQCCAPIVFFPKRFSDQIVNVEDITRLEPLYAEPMGNGMIEYSIMDEDDLWDTSVFLRFLKKQLGKEIYDPEEIALKRNFICK